MTNARIDITRCQNAKHHAGGKITAQCPACAEAGGDNTGEHLVIMADGKFGCIAFQGADGEQHRKRIFELIGVVSRDNLGHGVTRSMLQPRPTTKRAPRRPTRSFTDTEQAARQCAPANATLEAVYDYPRDGQQFAAVARYKIPGDKTFLQFHHVNTAWQTGAPASKWPLFRENDLPAKGTIHICEGEKAALAAISIGLPAATSAGGSKAAAKTDWTALAGRDVTILPDNDAPGETYAAAVTRILSELIPPATVKICRLPGLPEGGDIVDFLDARDAVEPETLRQEIERLTANADTVKPTPTEPEIDAGNEPRLSLSQNPIPAAAKGQPMARSDTGLAERFTYYHGTDVAYQAESGQWFTWNGQRWQRDAGLVEIRRRFAETARRIKDEVIRLPKHMSENMRVDHFRFAMSCEQIGRMDAAARLAPSLGLARPLAMFDADSMLLACSNGTVDLKTGELRPHRREDFITKTSSVEFHPDTANDPSFRAFISHATGGDAELETYLQRAAGYTLSGAISEKCLFIVYSELTDTSKTCFVTGLLTAAGDYGMTISFDALLEPDRGGQPNYDIAKLCGTRLAVASETKPGRRFAAELIKQLTGGDTLRAREIRQSSIEFRPTHKLWLCTNHAPTLADGGDAATWNRLRRVPFNNQVPREKRDPRFLAALSDPASVISKAFLAWAVQGAVTWQKSGLGGCQAVDDSTAAYQTETDPLIDFLEDMCSLDRTAATTAADLRHAYEAWAADNGQRFTLSRQRFAAVLRKHGCQEHKGTGGTRRWLGIKLRGLVA